MFVLPPPPKYPSTVGTGQPILETSNQLKHHDGPEHQLIVGEGTYILRDELHLATPPPHPSEAPIVNPNPLATNIQPPTSGTKLSLAIIIPKHIVISKHGRPDTPTSEAGTSSRGASNPDVESNRDSKTGSLTFRSNQLDQNDHSRLPVFGANNPALAASNGKDAKAQKGGGPRKPKNNIIKSNSSYISRVIPHEALQRRQQEHALDGIYAFANINRALQWLDLSSPIKVENLTKVLFTKAHALCHDINQFTKSSTHLDFVMGSSTGDFIWYEPMSQKYARINKNGLICNSPVSDVKWLPNSENFFLAAHFDGSLIVYDKEKDEVAFTPENEVNGHANGVNGTHDEKGLPKMKILKSVNSRNQKTNPVAYWKLSNSKVNALAFSPSGQYLAVASEDGGLRVLDYLSETLRDVFISYYGGLLSVTWSPDSRYILTGGQDDLVSIWSVEEATLVARCQGHQSWVVDVKFDPWRCDERNYRFGSVGEDCRLLLWDFSVGMLHRPRAASVRQRASVSSAVPRNRSEADGARLRSDSNRSNGSTGYEDVVHPVQPRNRTAILPPVMAKQVDDHPLCWLDFEEDCIMTSCRDGHIKTWDRPREGTGDALEVKPATTGGTS